MAITFGLMALAAVLGIAWIAYARRDARLAEVWGGTGTILGVIEIVLVVLSMAFLRLTNLTDRGIISWLLMVVAIMLVIYQTSRPPESSVQTQTN